MTQGSSARRTTICASQSGRGAHDNKAGTQLAGVCGDGPWDVSYLGSMHMLFNSRIRREYAATQFTQVPLCLFRIANVMFAVDLLRGVSFDQEILAPAFPPEPTVTTGASPDPVQRGRSRARIPRQYFSGIKPSPIMANWLTMNPIRGPNARSINP